MNTHEKELAMINQQIRDIKKGAKSAPYSYCFGSTELDKLKKRQKRLQGLIQRKQR